MLPGRPRRRVVSDILRSGSVLLRGVRPALLCRCRAASLSCSGKTGIAPGFAKWTHPCRERTALSARFPARDSTFTGPRLSPAAQTGVNVGLRASAEGWPWRILVCEEAGVRGSYTVGPNQYRWRPWSCPEWGMTKAGALLPRNVQAWVRAWVRAWVQALKGRQAPRSDTTLGLPPGGMDT